MPRSHSPTLGIALPVPLVIDAGDALDAPGQWVVCGGAIREATSGLVACPVTGSSVPVAECIGCHCLVTHSGERDPRTDCALPEGV